MEKSELNNYLRVLEGFGDIEFIEREKDVVSGRGTVKFSGDIGSIDKGKIELTLFGVEVMNLPFRVIPNFEFAQKDSGIASYIGSNEIEEDCHLYTIKDDTKSGLNHYWVLNEFTLMIAFLMVIINSIENRRKSL